MLFESLRLEEIESEKLERKREDGSEEFGVFIHDHFYKNVYLSCNARHSYADKN